MEALAYSAATPPAATSAGVYIKALLLRSSSQAREIAFKLRADNHIC